MTPSKRETPAATEPVNEVWGDAIFGPTQPAVGATVRPREVQAFGPTPLPSASPLVEGSVELVSRKASRSSQRLVLGVVASVGILLGAAVGIRALWPQNTPARVAVVKVAAPAPVETDPELSPLQKSPGKHAKAVKRSKAEAPKAAAVSARPAPAPAPKPANEPRAAKFADEPADP